MVPGWLHDLALAYLSFGGLCALVIATGLIRHPQNMRIMNVVWPTVALFGTASIVWQYFRYGRLAERARVQPGMQRHEEMPNRKYTPFPLIVANATLHCGSGCTLGDILAEWLVWWVPAVAVAFGYQSVFGEKMFAAWIVDYLFAYAFGIVFQYFTIAPMRGLPLTQGLWVAIKADTLSLTAWQVGMYGFMALANFHIFRTLLGARLDTAGVEFWFMMQIAMLCGFVTAYPVNYWLLRVGIKEPM